MLLGKQLISNILNKQVLKSNSPTDEYIREAKTIAATGPSAYLESVIFKAPEKQFLTTTLFNHHEKKLVNNNGKEPRERREKTL